ncbi:maleylpyruvate isomerase family mycothiol-dependent enzyme [Nocardia miyunensis]|uniref:maleylpyruvate isomerase family mycothiol-dependent enzyme n=1 Tax=Nocardia miyunensis TaxID=282684 RepID=UPI00082B98F1|nr:maleylpyruvate isomerase family mycothiol-dependent enzyme [Nocardia miyunensis]
MEMARLERADLAEFLATLTPEQWEQPSLCKDWRIRDVVAHMISYEELGRWGLLRRFAKGKFLYANDVGVREFSLLGPEQLLQFLGEHLVPRGLTAGFGGMIALVDGTIHHQDIRRPLGIPRQIPTDRLTRVLDATLPNPRLGAWHRIRGLRLHANDIDWSHGTGPEVTGTGEALLLAITGRPSVLGELTGPGRKILADRIGA